MHRLRQRPRRPGSPDTRDERGAVALEAALVFMFLFALLAGVVDLSMYFKTSYQLSSGARAAARTAASEPLAATYAQDAAAQVVNSLLGMEAARVQSIWVYNANTTTGEPVNAGCAADCVRFAVTSDAQGKITGVGASTGTWPNRSACATGTPTIQSVGVRVAYRYDAPVRFAENSVITESSVMRFEEIPSTRTCAT